jgi:hypothetical protein
MACEHVSRVMRMMAWPGRSKTALVWTLAPRATDVEGLLPLALFLWSGRPVKMGLSALARKDTVPVTMGEMISIVPHLPD